MGVETIRYYQRRGLLRTPERGGAGGSGGGVRRYDAEDVRRLRFIRSAQTAGFTLEQIAELLALDSSEDRDRARALARERIAALDSKIAELAAARASLLRLARACDASVSGACPIIAAFEGAPHRD
ncbi:MAG: MerR family DNA-binding protein [Caulobacter sp.]|nr:MerR family DNA-binding protein [Caulobacter sp.]